jgi:hypothetical protein
MGGEGAGIGNELGDELGLVDVVVVVVATKFTPTLGTGLASAPADEKVMGIPCQVEAELGVAVPLLSTLASPSLPPSIFIPESRTMSAFNITTAYAAPRNAFKSSSSASVMAR